MQTFTGTQYLMMDIASSFGLDKCPWQDRLDWFHVNESTLEAQVGAAAEPAQFLAGVQAYRKAQQGIATGYLCGLDSTASGLQILSLLAGCTQSASICNLVNTGRREDAYTTVYLDVVDRVGTHGTIPRGDVKQALMTHLYGSKKVPREVFGEDTPQLASFYDVINERLPGANQLNEDLLALWQPTALAHSWTLPDGFDVVIKVMGTAVHTVEFLGDFYQVQEKVNQAQDSGLSMGANIVHSIDGMIVREMNRRCNYTLDQVNDVIDLLTAGVNGKATSRAKDIQLLRLLELFEQTGFMSAAIIEYLDASNCGHLDHLARTAFANLINTMPERPFPVICIHDCFKFHPNYGNDVRRQYRNILAELAGSTILDSIATQITGRPIQVSKLGFDLPTLIQDSEYAIC